MRILYAITRDNPFFDDILPRKHSVLSILLARGERISFSPHSHHNLNYHKIPMSATRLATAPASASVPPSASASVPASASASVSASAPASADSASASVTNYATATATDIGLPSGSDAGSPTAMDSASASVTDSTTVTATDSGLPTTMGTVPNGILVSVTGTPTGE
jgi:hypothetical protein